jgi:hypothetical protein
MVPAALIELPALPLTPNGKLDRRGLPAPSALRRSAGAEAAPPLPGLEQELAGLWRRLLGVEAVGRHENFFDAGGHSLLLPPLLRDARALLGAELSMLDLFEHPTIASMAAHVQSARGAGARAPGNGRAGADTPPGPVAAEADVALERAREGKRKLQQQRTRRRS